ncbi:MAG: ABC transporter permease [Chloroflexi bacterium]|jgi:ABC-type dipeptide/oligopeptide/nickel transport system permease subunit|nr:ABC transporter permease [Chloroflexota bacterium]
MTIATTRAIDALPAKRSTWLTLWLRFRRRKAAVVGLVIILAQIILAILAPVVSPYDPNAGDYPAAWQGPSAKHWLGADDLGRDVLSRLIYGARISIAVGILSQLSVVIIGLPIGALAGLLGGWVDYLVMRVIEILAALPTILLYIMLMVALGPGFVNIIIAMSLTGWLGIARLVRGQVLSLKQTDYVRAARAMGGDTKHIIVTHLVRNALSPVLVTITLGVPGAMFAEAGLSFLGLGIRPPDPSWGQMIGLYQSYIQSSWHLTVFPAIILAITMLAWHLVGDGLRDALDPTIRV